MDNREFSPPYIPIDAQGDPIKEKPKKTQVPRVMEGQGSFRPGLLKDVQEFFMPIAQIASAVSGKDIAIMAENKNNELSRTDNAQLVTAAYIISCNRVLDRDQHTEAPYLAGKSLGFNVAAFEAGVFGDPTENETLSKFFAFIVERGKFMQAVCDKLATGMAGIEVSNLKDWQIIEALMAKHGLSNAFFLDDTRRRIAGKLSDLEAFTSETKSMGIKFNILHRVSGAFHTHFFAEAQQQLEKFVNGLELYDPKVPLVSNTRPIRLLTTAKEVKEEMIRIITEPVDEQGMMDLLVSLGYETFYQVGQKKPFEEKDLVEKPKNSPAT